LRIDQMLTKQFSLGLSTLLGEICTVKIGTTF
jgi:hypothetical protein